MKDYIKWIRSKVGNELIFLNCAGACIMNERDQILLQKRSRVEELWGFPGGIMELGESIEETMIREVKEETGLTVKAEYLIGVYSKYYDEYKNGDKAQPIVHFFKCAIIDGELTTDGEETHELKYFDSYNAPELFNQQHRDMLTDVIKNKVGVFR